MNLNLYLKELKRSRKNLIIWLLIVIGFTVMILGIYPYMEEMGEGISDLMKKMPAELGKALGLDANTWSSIVGFYSLYYGIYIILLVGIYTASTGATIISKEEKERTAEFLFTKPISRKSIVISKLFALFTLTMIIYFIQTITAAVCFSIFGNGNVDWSVVGIMHFHGLILVLFFTCTGVILSMFFRPKKNFMGMVVGIIFGFYFINAMSKAADAVSWLGYISPFHYLEFTVNDPGYEINILASLVLLILGFSLLFLTLMLYKKKDIES